jgi:hypothetical protein
MCKVLCFSQVRIAARHREHAGLSGDRLKKPSATPSMVRIHHLPPPAKTAPDRLKRGQGLSPSYAVVSGS